MEGVMMRNGDIYGLAVRRPDSNISAQRLPWRVLTKSAWLRRPLIRGFPILLETMVNGIHALNRSMILSGADSGDCRGGGMGGMILSLALALCMAIALFVVAPHLLSVLMFAFGLGGDVEGLSFHLWDGFYKCGIFTAYIWAISFVPDIHRVFQYHGAEHKTIHAFESCEGVDSRAALRMSRLHPRCGTTFLLFVIAISIVVQAIVVPFLLQLWTPESELAKHALSLGYKLPLVLPISALAYELIRFAAKLQEGFWATVLQAPGLFLQRLTTREPSLPQLEVAIVALAEALGAEAEDVSTVPYVRVPADNEDLPEK